MNEALNLNKTDEISEDAGQTPSVSDAPQSMRQETETTENTENTENAENIENTEVSEDAKKTVFLSSLQMLTEDDIILNETAQNVKKAPVDFVRYFILLILTGTFIYSGYSIVMQFLGYAEAANVNNSILEVFYSDEEIGEVQTLKKARANQPIQDILSLQKPNVREVGAIVSDGISKADQMRTQLDRLKFTDIPDLYGWIRISNTTIEYPVVQSDDNDYYLTRNVYGHNQQSGAIYVDYRNDKNLDRNLNTILYGHNMNNRTMFSDLMNFHKYQDLFNSGMIEFSTQDGVYYYEIFSVHIAHPELYYRETTFQAKNGLSAEEEYVRWLYEMKSFSIFQKDYIEFTPDSKIITLSTCTNTLLNPRLAVHGVLIDVLR